MQAERPDRLCGIHRFYPTHLASGHLVSLCYRPARGLRPRAHIAGFAKAVDGSGTGQQRSGSKIASARTLLETYRQNQHASELILAGASQARNRDDSARHHHDLRILRELHPESPTNWPHEQHSSNLLKQLSSIRCPKIDRATWRGNTEIHGRQICFTIFPLGRTRSHARIYCMRITEARSGHRFP